MTSYGVMLILQVVKLSMLTKEEMENINIDGRIYLCYDLLVPISKDRVLATHGDNISLIDINGNMIATYDLIIVPEYLDTNYMIDDNTAAYTTIDDYLTVYHGGKVGVIDYDGKIVVPIEYSSIEFSSPTEVNTLP
jgi:hypothetical protein